MAKSRSWGYRFRIRQRDAFKRETYDPATGTWTATGAMTTGRLATRDFVAQWDVLVTGGGIAIGTVLPTAQSCISRERELGHQQPDDYSRSDTRQLCCPMEAW